ncbi:hypothetical protein [Streptomyces europaeiscabiei]|uniref:hypothetical protein n=1 Tax=Streptomyces europaeiscabiei TaxID=146819 RepID=UPI0029A31FD0|nr:hypothetical protein [Streptomyces europaeiscabiei]MDX3775983.1 hypothetical protein [Streptomyces europaeiscabiei]
MDNTPISDALALRATASAFDAQRGKLPVPGDPHRSPDAVAVARQISELGELITDLGDEVLFRAAGQDQAPHTARVITSFAAAVEPAGEAASALGAVAHQLAFLNQTESLRDQPDARDAREAAVRVLEDALATADAALHDGANSLHSASATVSPPSVRLQAARSRSTTTAPTLGSPPPGVTTAVASSSDRLARGR